MLADVFIILSLILLNGFLAASEIALISSRKARLEVYIKKGNRAASEALKLHRTPNRFLSTVQIGITLISILTGLYSGAAFAPFFEQFIRSEEHTSELQSLMRISYAVFCLKKKNPTYHHIQDYSQISFPFSTVTPNDLD